MEWSKILESVLIALITGAISAGVAALTVYLKKKAALISQESDNAIVQSLVNTGCDIIINLVNATSQTVVDDLKKQGLFNKEKQLEVFNHVAEVAEAQMSEDIKKAIEKTYGVVIGDFIRTKIESVIAENK